MEKSYIQSSLDFLNRIYLINTILISKYMKLIGYWTSQEQYSMHDLIKFVIEAEKGGFITTMTSDHFHPWWHDNGYGNFTWVWLAAAAERTKNMRFVTGVTAAVYRYNPAIIAQAFASLDVLYPGRIALGVGTGEAMNEVSVGFDWPTAEIRLKRTTESIKIIKQLWNKKEKKKQTDSNTLDYDKENNDEDFITLMENILKYEMPNSTLLLLPIFLCIWQLPALKQLKQLQNILKD